MYFQLLVSPIAYREKSATVQDSVENSCCIDHGSRLERNSAVLSVW